MLSHREVPSWCDPSLLCEKGAQALRRLMLATKSNVVGLDWALLVRQCLRRVPVDQQVRTSRFNQKDLALLSRVDVYQNLDGTIEALPYVPSWVSGLGDMALDHPTESSKITDESIFGEPWLVGLVGKAAWKSAAQKDVTWTALNAAPNSTLLVGLPTGSGKSLVYQCSALFQPGMTVVVVPTVALGIDQLAALKDLACADQLRPLFYTSDDNADFVLSEVDSRRCRLLVTSPEAIVSGRLGAVLLRQAGEGYLQQLVIDEAHLIESWGAEFRVEFQLLGAVLRKWREQSPNGIKTLLLSATFSPQAPAMLKRMFSNGDGLWQQRVIQRLRPEIHYFSASTWATEDDQILRVTEALLYLPRPAILYVTEKSKAVAWGIRIAEMGFERFRVFHGDTPTVLRTTILDEWRKDELDLVVATSAFGMGVDKSDVKTIIHACLPEGIDRFYQEVGRGGRDGTATISLLVPGGRDQQIANLMGPTLLADPKKIQGRWDAMWGSRSEENDGRFSVHTAVRPTYHFGTETYGESIRWNKRLLLLMERADLILIVGLDSRIDEMSGEYIERAIIQLRRNSFQLEHNLAGLLQEQRIDEDFAVKDSLNSLMDYFNARQVICKQLQLHFGEQTQRACGSCTDCRTGKAYPRPARRLQFGSDIKKSKPQVHLVGIPWRNSVEMTSWLVVTLRRILRLGLTRRFFVSANYRDLMNKIFAQVDDTSVGPYRIDDIVDFERFIIAEDERIIVFHFDSIDLTTAHINECGSIVAHWQFGGEIENQPGRWPFMREYGARPYVGLDAMNNWIEDIQRPNIYCKKY